MSRQTPLQHASRLLDSARALERAVAAGEPEALLAAGAERDAVFEALRTCVGEDPPVGIHDTLRKVREIDERILARVPALQDGIRRERQLLGMARDAARAVRQTDAPRFLDLHA